VEKNQPLMNLHIMCDEVDKFTNVANNDGKPNEELINSDRGSEFANNSIDRMNNTQPIQK